MITELEMGKAESELELGLGLSLGGGTASKIGKSGGVGGSGAWGERGRLLTAKDFPSVGSKRAADSASHAGASPPRSSQVVGWPPIGSHRMNSLVNNQAAKSAREEEEAGKKKVKDDETKDVTKKANGKVQVGFIKVNMDGVAIGRKVDLNAHSSYENLAQTLEDMFFRNNPGTIGLTGQFTKPLRLLDGSSEFVLTYEDKEGDWMLVGDVPWRMFITSVKRLRVMKTSEANGLAARHQEPNERQRNQPV
ncbi:hypothetical protein EUTSA_v10017143mg [Eutrema salsugineum]|uniref:Auxin-responsive protein n=1 Tax=Eutrema salsugineum TaxID=72664 RepID=V4M9X9_EUTSA|nr:auxin-responsive protein IAA13 isoform X2 [Eutrema salsugineum]ESQ51922.1 hypothetical protein EUTSA_v10017143mg [Eutrema salsugineum]